MTDFHVPPAGMRALPSPAGEPDAHQLADDAAVLAVPSRVDRRTGSRPQQLLIADDQDDLRRMWRFWLDLSNFTVVEARDGLEALAHAQSQRPLAIVMDLWMPRLDGLSAVERIRASQDTAGIPIIGVTAQGLHTRISDAFAGLCDIVLEKPIDPEELLNQIRKALGLRRDQA